MNKREPRTVCVYIHLSRRVSQTGRSGHDKRARRDEKVKVYDSTGKKKFFDFFLNKIKIPPPPSLSVVPLRPRCCCLHYTGNKEISERTNSRVFIRRENPLYWSQSRSLSFDYETFWWWWLRLTLTIHAKEEDGNKRRIFRRALMHERGGERIVASSSCHQHLLFFFFFFTGLVALLLTAVAAFQFFSFSFLPFLFYFSKCVSTIRHSLNFSTQLEYTSERERGNKVFPLYSGPNGGTNRNHLRLYDDDGGDDSPISAAFRWERERERRCIIPLSKFEYRSGIPPSQ